MKLGDISTIQSGLTLRGGPASDPDGLLAVQLSDLTSDGGLDRRTELRVDERLVSWRHLVGPGDVLFRSRGLRPIAWAVDDSIKEPAVAISPLFIVRPDTEVIDSRYLAWYLNQPAAQRHFAEGARGTSLRMIGKPVLETVQIDLPPVHVQRSIAELSALAAQEKALSALIAERKNELLAYKLGALAHTSSISPTPDRTT